MENDSARQDLPAGLSRPAQQALASAGIHHLEDLTRFREYEVASLHGMGPKGMRLLREAMTESGLAFAAETAG